MFRNEHKFKYLNRKISAIVLRSGMNKPSLLFNLFPSRECSLAPYNYSHGVLGKVYVNIVLHVYAFKREVLKLFYLHTS